MSGARYTGEVPIHVVGDRNEASKRIPLARKVIGYVLLEAGRQNLQTYIYRFPTPDGGEIIGELHGGLPRLTIIVPPPSGNELEPEPTDNFVVHARDAVYPDGIDVDFPQQILDPTPAWKTYFYNEDITGYAAFLNSKGTYGGTFLEGVKHAGNLDHCNEAGMRVSWGGPSTRYFLDAYAQPSAQFGHKVFMLGQVILDIDDYIANIEVPEPDFEERWILGAALHKTGTVYHLYVVHSFIYDAATSTGTAMFNIAFDNPYPSGDITTVLSRFTLVEDPLQPISNRWTVGQGTRVELYRGDLFNATVPWFFNPQCTQTTTFPPPENIAAAISGGNLAAGPDTSQEIFQLDIDIDAETAVLATRTVSLLEATDGTGPTVAAVTCDYDEDGSILELLAKRTPRGHTIYDVIPTFSLSFKGTDYVVMSAQLVVGPGSVEVSTHRGLIWADLRANTFVFIAATFVRTSPSPTFDSVNTRVEIWRGGVLVGEVPVDPDDCIACGLGYTPYSGVYADAVRTVDIAPAFLIYGISYGSEFLVARFIRHYGCHAIYRYRPYPADQHFGARILSATLPGTWVPFTTESGFAGDAEDADGKSSVAGAASFKGTTMVSCYGFNPSGDVSVSWVDERTLPDLTSVDGDNQRYHPIYLLGKPPKSST